ncbi:MAG: hypothetical protein FWD68_15640 [Alphaproteobacteria bacterium]|nr:hypothetical protein [Alphaproteobacteria bacterium]
MARIVPAVGTQHVKEPGIQNNLLKFPSTQLQDEQTTFPFYFYANAALPWLVLSNRKFLSAQFWTVQRLRVSPWLSRIMPAGVSRKVLPGGPFSRGHQQAIWWNTSSSYDNLVLSSRWTVAGTDHGTQIA